VKETVAVATPPAGNITEEGAIVAASPLGWVPGVTAVTVTMSVTDPLNPLWL
jgi:hypothetical protein